MKNKGLYITLLVIIIITLLICFKGINIHHDMGGKKQKITIPESTNTIEIPRSNGKDPIKFNLKMPEKKIQIEKD